MKNNRTKHSTLTEFLLHLHPAKIDKRALAFNKTFGLGGINALLFLILAVSGSILRFLYVPTVEKAYASIVFLRDATLLGSFLRNVHHFAAMLFVLSVFLHMLRVFYSLAFFNERKKNWYYGLALAALVFSANFAGYLLPWDQLSYWAVTVMTSTLEYIPLIGKFFANIIRGGETVNGDTLMNFYVLHTSVIPASIFLLMILHFWLVRNAGGIALPRDDAAEKTNVNPALVSKEILTALAVVAFVFALALIFDAPLLEIANYAVSPNPVKAPWYFSGVQELLVNVHPVVSVFLLPLALLIFFLYIPSLKIPDDKTGVRFYSEKGKKATVYSALFAASLSFTLILLFEYVLKSAMCEMPSFLSTGIIPIVLYFAPAGVFVFYIAKKFVLSKTELILVFGTMIFSSYVTMGAVTYFLRGYAMKLIF